MKALFTFLFLTFCICNAVLAQSPEQSASKRPTHIIGFRAGGNLSNFSGNDPFIDPYLGFHAGVFADMHPSKKYGYSLELNYSKQGANYNEISISTHYLVLPLLFNLYVSEVALQGGLYAAPLLVGSVNNTDLGLAIGIKRALGTAGIGVRYYHGLQNVSDSRNSEVNQKLELSLRINL